MPITEAQAWIWISSNWPSVAAGLSAGITYVAVYLRLVAHLSRLEKVEKELLRSNREVMQLRIRVVRLTVSHCQRHPEDLERLMRIDEGQDEEDK